MQPFFTVVSGSYPKFKQKMRKLFATVALALTLGLAAPQNANAGRTDWPDGSYTTYTYAGSNIVKCAKYDKHGKLLRIWFVRVSISE